LEFNVPFQHKYGYIRDDIAYTCSWLTWWVKKYTELFDSVMEPRSVND